MLNTENSTNQPENPVRFPQLQTVTPLSKILAGVLFITFPFIGGWIGYSYAPAKSADTIAVMPQEAVNKLPVESSEQQNQEGNKTYGFLDDRTLLPLFPSSPFWEISNITESNVNDSWYEFLHNDKCFTANSPVSGVCPKLRLIGTEYTLVNKLREGSDRLELDVSGWDFAQFYYDFNSHRAVSKSTDGLSDEYSDAGYLYALGFKYIGGSDGIPTREFKVFQKQIGDKVQTVIVRHSVISGPSSADYVGLPPAEEVNYSIFVSEPYEVSQ